jgi:hypothetical protein
MAAQLRERVPFPDLFPEHQHMDARFRWFQMTLTERASAGSDEHQHPNRASARLDAASRKIGPPFNEKIKQAGFQSI